MSQAADVISSPTTSTATDRYADGPWTQRITAWVRENPYRASLIGVTLFSAVLRMLWLDFPTLLYDEAATWSRVTGSFQELLDILQHDGFAPLHYEIYWVLGRVFDWSPELLRLIPALAGIAMIPAMYFLARQVTGRNGALLAAIFTACSAYMLVYSRDAKMYMPLWLCCALSTACLLDWLRSGRRVMWLSWILCSLGMVGLHALGLIVLGVQLLVLLTYPRLHVRRAGLFIVGAVVPLAALGAHYLIFNVWTERVQEKGWHESGLIWIANHNEGFTRPYLTFDAFSSYLWAYRRPRVDVTPPKRVAVPIVIAGTMMGVFLALGAMPWPKRWRQRDDDPPVPGWRGGLWLAAWIILPFYAFYCISFADAVGPHQLLLESITSLGGWWILLLPVVGLLGLLAVRSKAVLALCGVLLALAVVAPITLSVIDQAIDRVPTWPEDFFRFELLPRLMTVTAIVALAISLWRARHGDERMANHLRRLLPSVGLIVALCGLIWLGTIPFRGHDVFQARYLGVVWPAFAIVLAILILRLPAPILRQVAVVLFIAYNMWQFTWRMASDFSPLEQLASDVARAQGDDANVRTFIQRRNKDGRLWPMTTDGGIFDLPGKFYLSKKLDLNMRPLEIREGDIADRVEFLHDMRARTVQAILRANPRVDTVIYWADGPSPDDEGILKDRLGPGWKRKDTRLFVVKDFWNWRKTFRCHRIVYKRNTSHPPVASAD